MLLRKSQFWMFIKNYSTPHNEHPVSILSVQFSRSVVSDSLRPHGLQHARPPCPSPTPGAHPNPCPLSRWCHPTISSSVVPFSACPQYFPASGSFQTSQPFASGGQRTGISASTSVLPVNTQDWPPLLTVLFPHLFFISIITKNLFFFSFRTFRI